MKDYLKYVKIGTIIFIVILVIGGFFEISIGDIKSLSFALIAVLIVFFLSSHKLANVLTQVRINKFKYYSSSVNPRINTLLIHYDMVIIALILIIYSVAGMIFNFFALPKVASFTGGFALLCNIILLLAGLQLLVAIYLYHTRKRKLERKKKN